MKYRLRLVLVLVLAAAPYLRAATDTIAVDSTWTLAGSPYTLANNLVVSSGATLTIQPGVVVQTSLPLSFDVAGTLDAQGTVAQPIVFSSLTLNSKNVITLVRCDFSNSTVNFKSSTVPTVSYCTFDTSYALFDTAAVSIDHCSFKNGTQSLLRVRFSTGSPAITACTLNTSTGSYGIYMLNASSATLDSLVVNGAGTYGIWMQGCSPIITNSTVAGHTYGVYCGFSAYPIIWYNTIRDNGTGVSGGTSSAHIQAQNNCWGSVYGPYHPTLNPAGDGNAISGYADFSPWHTSCTGSPLPYNPSNGGQPTPLTVTLQWTPGIGADSYSLQVFDSFSTLTDTSGLTDTSFVLSGLSYETSYSFRVRADYDGGGASDWSDSTFFTTMLGPPTPPTIIYPADSAANMDTSVSFFWVSDANASSYRLQISAQADFSSFLLDTSTTATVVTSYGFSFDSTYYWRLNGTNGEGTGDWTTIRRFTTKPFPPDAPVLIAPANGDTNQPLSLNLLWNSAAHAVSYTVVVATDSVFSGGNTVFNANQTDTGYTLSGLSNLTTYYWKVASLNITDTNWSAYGNFITIIAAPPAPELLSPSDAATDVSLSPALNWKQSYPYTAIRFWFQVSTDSLFATLADEDSTLTDTTVSLSGLSMDTRHFWRVRAGNVGGFGEWSASRTFSTIPPAPGAPQLVAPGDDTTSINDTVNFIWHPVAGATHYNCQYSTDSAFVDYPVTKPNLTDTTVTVVLSKGTLYSWRVNAKNGGGTGDYSAAWRFTTIVAAPSYPQIVSPSWYSSHPVDSVTFIWKTASRASSYRLQLSNYSSFASVLRDTGTITDTTCTIYGLDNATTYYWRVNASNEGGTGVWSSAPQFTTHPLPPDAPTLSTPADSATDIPTSPTLSWNASSGATWYQLQVAVQSDFSTTVYDDNTLTGTSGSVTALSTGTRCFWRVRARNSGGNGPWSLIRTFTTVSAPPDAVTLLYPEASVSQIPTTPALLWSTAATASSYNLQIATDPSFSAPVIDTAGLSDTSCSVTLSHDTQYYWRVQAVNSAGPSAWSTTYSFRTVIAAPSPPALVGPASGSANLSIPVLMQWNPSSGAASYRLQVSTASDFSVLVLDSYPMYDTAYGMSALSDSTRYYWRISASNDGGTSAWSDTADFVTAPPLPSAPVLVSPLAYATSVAVDLTFHWNQAGGADTYGFQVSTDASFATTFASESGLTDTSFTVNGLAHDIRYHWRVGATNAAGTTWSPSRYFTTIINTPAAPTLVAPTNGSVDQSADYLLLHWNNTSGATSYGFQISTDTAFSTLLYTASGITDTMRVFDKIMDTWLTNGTTYYWRVNAVNAAGTGPWSDTFSFTTIIAKPESPALAAPSVGETGVSSPLVLRWNLAARAAVYHLHVSTSANFLQLLIDSSDIVDTACTLTTLTSNTLYYWRVSAGNEGGTSDWSSVGSFTTAAIPPAIPVLVSPASGQTNASTQQVFTWNRVDNATAYSLDVGTDSTFTEKSLGAFGLTDTTYSYGNLGHSLWYYWRVAAVNTDGTTWSATWRFRTVVDTPLTPSPLLPEHNATNLSTSVTFSWTAADSAQNYGIQVSTSADFSTRAVDTTGLLSSSFFANNLSHNTQYYWRVNAANIGGTSDWSYARSFTTIVAPPAPPAVISPTNGATGVSIAPTLLWNEPARALSYRVELSMTSNFSSLVYSHDGLTDTVRQLSGLDAQTTYYWRVNASNAGGTGDWSVVQSFTTVVAAPGTPVCVLPQTGATDVSTSPSFRWQSVPAASSYRVQLAADAGFSSLVRDSVGVSDTGLVLSGLANAQTYYWRVNAANDGGDGGWSGTQSFTTIVAAPGIPVCELPQTNAADVATSASLRWQFVATASSYRVQLAADLGFSSLVQDSVGVADTELVLAGLANATTYYWRVNASNAGGTGGWSTPFSFTTAIAPPDAPAPVSPLDSAVNVPVAPVVSWHAASRASSYRLQVSIFPDFLSRAYEKSLAGTLDTVAGLAHNTTYFWRVAAENTTGPSAWSVIRRFTTIVPLPSALLMAAPSAVDTVTVDSLVLNWQAGTPAITRYWLEISSDSGMADPIVIDSALLDTFALVRLVPTTYWWRVRAQNAAGWGPFGEKRSFTIRLPSTAVLPREFALSISGISSGSRIIRYALPRKTRVEVRLINAQGRENMLVRADQSAGFYSLELARDRVARGWYYVVFRAGEVKIRKRITLLN